MAQSVAKSHTSSDQRLPANQFGASTSNAARGNTERARKPSDLQKMGERNFQWLLLRFSAPSSATFF
jgi:hypothetical protein